MSSSSPAERHLTIPLIQRIVKFGCRTVRQAADLAYVNTLFEETMKSYHTTHILLYSDTLLHSLTAKKTPCDAIYGLMKRNSTYYGRTYYSCRPLWFLQEVLLIPHEMAASHCEFMRQAFADQTMLYRAMRKDSDATTLQLIVDKYDSINLLREALDLNQNKHYFFFTSCLGWDHREGNEYNLSQESLKVLIEAHARCGLVEKVLAAPAQNGEDVAPLSELLDRVEDEYWQIFKSYFDACDKAGCLETVLSLRVHGESHSWHDKAPIPMTLFEKMVSKSKDIVYVAFQYFTRESLAITMKSPLYKGCFERCRYNAVSLVASHLKTHGLLEQEMLRLPNQAFVKAHHYGLWQLLWSIDSSLMTKIVCSWEFAEDCSWFSWFAEYDEGRKLESYALERHRDARDSLFGRLHHEGLLKNVYELRYSVRGVPGSIFARAASFDWPLQSLRFLLAKAAQCGMLQRSLSNVNDPMFRFTSNVETLKVLIAHFASNDAFQTVLETDLRIGASRGPLRSIYNNDPQKADLASIFNNTDAWNDCRSWYREKFNNEEPSIDQESGQRRERKNDDDDDQ